MGLSLVLEAWPSTWLRPGSIASDDGSRTGRDIGCSDGSVRGATSIFSDRKVSRVLKCRWLARPKSAFESCGATYCDVSQHTAASHRHSLAWCRVAYQVTHQQQKGAGDGLQEVAGPPPAVKPQPRAVLRGRRTSPRPMPDAGDCFRLGRAPGGAPRRSATRRAVEAVRSEVGGFVRALICNCAKCKPTPKTTRIVNQRWGSVGSR